MGLPREEVVSGSAAELARFEELIRPLSVAEWKTPTRCAGWATGDVAKHVAGTIADIATGRFAELAAPDAPSRQVAERRGKSAREVADELHQATKVVADSGAAFDDAAWAGPAPPGIPRTRSGRVEAPWPDAYAHRPGTCAALDRRS